MSVKRYNGSTWDTYAGATNLSATQSQWKKTAAGGETTLSGSDDSLITLAYTVGQEAVYVNGVLQVRGSDYTATDGSSVVLTSPLVANNVVQVISAVAYAVANVIPGTTITTKGDLVTGSAIGTPTRLPIGTNNSFLVADSTQATGIRWSTNGGTFTTWRKAAAGGETTLTGTDDFALTLAYTAGQEMVYINGVLLERGVDYTASNGTSVTGLTALVAGDVATVVTIGTFQIPNAIQLSQVTAKGDLIVANGAATVTNLPVGTDGSILVSNSLAGSGLSWAGANIGAGKNAIINGGFDIWQRGTTFTNPGSGGGVYTTDRWQAYFTQNGTVTQDTTLLLAGNKFGARVTATTSTAGNTDLFHLIEDVNTIPLQGKSITFSVYVAGTSGKTPYLEVAYSTTANDSLFNTSSLVVASSSITTSGSFQRITVTGTVPTTAKTLRMGLRSNNSLGLNEYLTWSDAQLEIGSIATPFSRAGGTIQGELAACQ